MLLRNRVRASHPKQWSPASRSDARHAQRPSPYEDGFIVQIRQIVFGRRRDSYNLSSQYSSMDFSV